MNESRPKAFIFENVKGLADPRNHKALDYILQRIRQAEYHARRFLLNAYDYGVPQTRVRIYIVGFKEKRYLDRLVLSGPNPGSVQLGDVLDDYSGERNTSTVKSRWSLSCNEQGFNDYFLFNDLRNGHTTIHSWDIIPTTDRQKAICYLLLQNRRKGTYGILDGNALGLEHFQHLDASVTHEELEELVGLGIFKHVSYRYEVVDGTGVLDENEAYLLAHARSGVILVDGLRLDKEVRRRKIGILETLRNMEERGVVRCIETRYDFRNGKISTGLNGINRIFLPTSKIYPTLVASDTNDFVSNVSIKADTEAGWKSAFMDNVFKLGKFRKISKSEACRIQGFPPDFKLPDSRPRWMKLIGNSVAVPVVRMLAGAVVSTGVFDEADWNGKSADSCGLFNDECFCG